MCCSRLCALVCVSAYGFTCVHALSRVLLAGSEQQVSDEFLRKFHPMPALLNLMSNTPDLTEVREYCVRACPDMRLPGHTLRALLATTDPVGLFVAVLGPE